MGRAGPRTAQQLQALGFRSFSQESWKYQASVFCVGSGVPVTFLGMQLQPCVSPKVYFGTSEELVSPGGKGMFGSHYSSFLWFLFKRSAPEIEPQSPISITCPIIQLGLFYSMKTPPELVTGFQLSHLQLSSLLWRFVLGEGIVLDGNWEENHSWGSSSSALEAKKMGCSQKSLLQLEIWVGLFQTRDWEGLFLQFSSARI